MPVLAADPDSAQLTGRGWPVRWRAFVTLATVERQPDGRRPALGRQDPGAVLPWRQVPGMLVVEAGQFGHPMAFLVLMKANNASLHRAADFLGLAA